MNTRFLALVCIVLAAIAWWVFSADPQDEVRNAHSELAAFIDKTSEDGDTLSVLDIRALQSLFADACVVSGDADALAGTCAPEEIAALVMRARVAFATIDLSLGELQIGFPAEGEAVTEFTATLHAGSASEAPGEFIESRLVRSTMHDIDGAWRFVSLHFARLDSARLESSR